MIQLLIKMKKDNKGDKMRVVAVVVNIKYSNNNTICDLNI